MHANVCEYSFRVCLAPNGRCLPCHSPFVCIRHAAAISSSKQATFNFAVNKCVCSNPCLCLSFILSIFCVHHFCKFNNASISQDNTTAPPSSAITHIFNCQLHQYAPAFAHFPSSIHPWFSPSPPAASMPPFAFCAYCCSLIPRNIACHSSN